LLECKYLTFLTTTLEFYILKENFGVSAVAVTFIQYGIKTPSIKYSGAHKKQILEKKYVYAKKRGFNR